MYFLHTENTNNKHVPPEVSEREEEEEGSAFVLIHAALFTIGVS